MNYLTRIISATFALLSFAIFSSCNDSNDDFSEVAQTKGLTIRALANGDSRTIFDGNEKTTSWAENDNLKICITGGGLNVTKDFSITNPSTGEFYNKDVTLINNQKYNFYAIYGASEVNSNIATIQIGSEEQVQEGASTAHIAALDPLYGSCENVAPDAVSIPMSHTAVVFKLNIKNTTGRSLNISRVEVAAPEGVVLSGFHTIDMKTGAITQSGLKTNQVELSLNGYSSVASGEAVTAWFATAPFVITAGGSLLFTVADSQGNEYDIVKSFDQNKNFQAGNVYATTLAIAAVAPTSVPVVFDFTDSSTFPPEAPTNKDNAVENLTCKYGHYTTDIYATNKCYNGGKLSFLDMMKTNDNSQYATITLPKISGYYISGIFFYNSKNLNSMKAELYKIDAPNTMLDDAIISSSTSEFDSKDLSAAGVNDDKAMFVKLFSTSISGSKYGLNKLEITYTRIGL
jgi:hypothetical protein